MSIINLKSPTELSGFYVVYNGSTNLESKGIYGISHLMEHLVCKSIDPYKDKMDMLGITDNAYTSMNEVVFWMRGLDSSLDKWRNKYVSLLGNFDITKTEFENERNIVLQEYSDSFNDQTSNHLLNLHRKKLGNYNPIGLQEDLENLSYIDGLNFYEQQFLNPSKIINVSKNTDFDMNVNFTDKETNRDFKIEDREVVIDRGNDYKGKVSLILMSDIIDDKFNQVNFINNMFCYGLQSPFYKEIREKRGLIYHIGMNLNRLDKKASNMIYTMTTPENVSEIVDIIGDIYSDVDKHFTEERFDIIKSSLNIKLQESEINRYQNVNNYINPKGWDMSDIIDDITYDDTLRVAKELFKMDNFIVSRDDQEFV